VKGINIDPKTQAESCGLSNPFPGSHDSNIYYETNMLQAQWALNVVINSPQDLTRALKRADLIAAIGAGIGNNAAHEIAHQFFQDTSGMDDNSRACRRENTRLECSFTFKEGRKRKKV
jgi:hypothetical protein